MFSERKYRLHSERTLTWMKNKPTKYLKYFDSYEHAIFM